MDAEARDDGQAASAMTASPASRGTSGAAQVRLLLYLPYAATMIARPHVEEKTNSVISQSGS